MSRFQEVNTCLLHLDLTIKLLYLEPCGIFCWTAGIAFSTCWAPGTASKLYWKHQCPHNFINCSSVENIGDFFPVCHWEVFVSLKQLNQKGESFVRFFREGGGEKLCEAWGMDVFVMFWFGGLFFGVGSCTISRFICKTWCQGYFS